MAGKIQLEYSREGNKMPRNRRNLLLVLSVGSVDYSRRGSNAPSSNIQSYYYFLCL